jgi:4-amino-4-deoxy-L-arabinose transferase-like glycosyltransferase
LPFVKPQDSERGRVILWLTAFGVAVGLQAFAQTLAGYGDEGFHLVAAHLVREGRRPYLDFFFQHPPLYLYLNALCLRLSGIGWRGPHAVAALLTGGAILLTADTLYRRSEITPAWRLPVALCAALFIGLNRLVLEFGTIAQPYAPCLFLGAAAFYWALQIPERDTGWPAALAGLSSSGAALCSLLAVPLSPIFLVWVLLAAPGKVRWKRAFQFVAGSLLPAIPLLWLLARGPRQVVFDLIGFQLHYRQAAFQTSVANWDFQIISEAIGSTQALLLIGFAVASVAVPSLWKKEQRQMIWLAAAIALGLALIAARAHPIFPQYFVLSVPFAGVLAALGVYSLGSGLWPQRPGWVVAAVVVLFSFRSLPEALSTYSLWKEFENAGRAMNEVAGPRDEIYSYDDGVYFAARRLPAPGLENGFVLYAPLPPELASLLHVATMPQLREWLAAGRFQAVLLEAKDRKIDELGLRRRYRHVREVVCHQSPHALFWDPIRP